MQASIIVPFRQANLLLINHDSQPFVPMKPVVEGMGLSWQGQHAKLASGRFASTIKEILIVAEDGKQRQMTCLPLRKLPGWMMSIHPNKVKPELRENIIAYQNECDDALWSYWNEGQATNPRKAKKPKALPGAITEEQQSIIRSLVKNHLETLPKEKQGAAARKCWGSLSKSFACKSYKDIPQEQFSEAVSLLSRRFLEGEFLGKAPTDTTLDELDLAMLYVFCIDTLELIHVGEEVKPIFDVLRPVKLINVPSCLSECREVVAHLHERFGPQMEQAARNRGAFDGRRNLAAAGDPSQPIWIPRCAQGIRG